MTDWHYHNPVRITFGAGASGEIAAALAGRSYLLVTYGEALFRGLAAGLAEVAGPPLAMIDNIAPNPDFAELGTSCDRLTSLAVPPQVIVALGGGSVIDTAKVLASAGGGFAPVRRLLERQEGEGELTAIPIIAVPTTAGTGSEVTCWATVWDREGGRKYSLSRPCLYPEQALVDPDLTLGLPREATICTGLDALSHALESIWNVNANPVSTNHAVAAGREVLATLPALADALDDRALRCRMAKAATMAGLAFSNTRTALAHSLSYPITLNYGAPHGLACSFSLPLVMRSVIGEQPDCDAALRRIFGPDLEAGADRLEAFLRDLGLSGSPAAFGVSAEAFGDLIDKAFDGERGRNFIGRLERVLDQAERIAGGGGF